MKKYYIFIIFSLYVFTQANAQVSYEVRQAIDLFRTNKMVSGDWKNWLEESDIEGSPYLNNKFVNGDVFMKNKQQYTDVPLRYNIYNDRVEFQSGENQISAIHPPEMVEKVELDGNEFEYISYALGKKTQRGYFLKLYDGKASLYSRLEVDYIQPVEPGAYKDPEPAKFVRKSDVYYIKVGEIQAQKVLKSKDIPDLFPDNQQKISDFVKKNKTKIKDPNEIIKVVKYYNSL